ncbi:hypothetical protein [Clostridium sp. DL1XJH146]
MKKGMIAAIFITIIVAIFFGLYAFGIIAGVLHSSIPSIVIIIVLLVFLALMGALIYNLYERIKEIKEEDKDDLSKY